MTNTSGWMSRHRGKVKFVSLILLAGITDYICGWDVWKHSVDCYNGVGIIDLFRNKGKLLYV